MKLTDCLSVVGYRPALVRRIGDFRAGVFLGWLLQEMAASDPSSHFTVAGASRLTGLTQDEVHNAVMILAGKGVARFGPNEGSDWISYSIALDHEVFE